MRHDHHKKCLVDSIMVDTSNGPWRGSPRAGVCWSGMRKRPSISEACDNWPVHCSGYDAGRDSSVIEIISKGVRPVLPLAS
jgi:hypothetical protein